MIKYQYSWTTTCPEVLRTLHAWFVSVRLDEDRVGILTAI